MANAQGFIQPVAQDAQRFIPNNGNPNTVYNVAPPGAAAGSGGWASSGVAPAANFTGTNVGQVIQDANQQTATQGWVAPTPNPQDAANAQKGLIQLPSGWAEEIKNFNPAAPTPTAPGGTSEPAKPTYDLNKQWIVMDGKVPRKNADLYANDPAYKAAWDQMFSEHQARMGKSIEDKRSDADVMAQALRNTYERYQNGWRPDPEYINSKGKKGSMSGLDPNAPAPMPGSVGGGGGGSGSGGPTGGVVKGVDLAALTSSITANPGRAEQRGWNSNPDKGIGDNLNSFINTAINSVTKSNTANSAMELIDKISEPFLPGNLYMSELGKTNLPNVLASVMNQVIPGLGTLGKWIADKIPDDAGGVMGKIRDFFRNGKYQEAANEIYKTLDQEAAQNQAIYGSGGGGQEGAAGGGTVGGGWLGGSVDFGSWGGGSGKVSIGDLKNIPVTSGSK